MKTYFHKAIIPLVVFVILCACGTGNISRQFTKTEAVRLLAVDSSKLWFRIAKIKDGNRVEFTSCEEGNSLFFQISITDSILYRIGRELSECTTTSGTAPDTLLKANWSLSQDINLISTDTLNLTDSDNKVLSPFVIRNLTPKKLNIQFIDDNADVVIEEYVY